MSDFYTKMGSTAGRLIKKFGQSVTITRTTGETRNPVTGQVTPGTDTVYTPNGILRKYPDNLIDGSRILSSDRMLILDDTIEPLPNDKPVLQGQTWSIKEIQTVKPAGTPLVYFVQVSK